MGLSPGLVKPDYKIDICCFFAKHTPLMSKKKNCPRTIVSVSYPSMPIYVLQYVFHVE
jgi:hypothetical protein